MNASDYEAKERFTIGVVEFVQKSKNCGKENCSACPHKGYWYARLPLYFVREGAAREVYLGRAWTDGTLRQQVAPLLRAELGKAFVALLDQQVTREEIVQLMDRAKWIEDHKRATEAAYKRDYHLLELQAKNNVKAIEDAQKRLRASGKNGAGGC